MSNFSDHLDRLENHTMYAQTLGVMLHELLCDVHEIPDVDTNHPASRTQRMFVVLETMQEKVSKIEEIERMIRIELQASRPGLFSL